MLITLKLTTTQPGRATKVVEACAQKEAQPQKSTNSASPKAIQLAI